MRFEKISTNKLKIILSDSSLTPVTSIFAFIFVSKKSHFKGSSPNIIYFLYKKETLPLLSNKP